MDGKALIVCMSRRICVELYTELVKLRPEWHGDQDEAGTPKVGETDACRMLHAPDISMLVGCRDHALLFTYVKTACRSRAIATAKVEDLVKSDHDWHLRVIEKGNKERRLPLLEAAPAVIRWLDAAAISLDK